jgi:DNA-binding beta-propeller fold protein YncE
MRIRTLFAIALLAAPTMAFAQAAPEPYKVLQKAAVGGAGGMDYVSSDPDSRQLLIPRGNRVDIFDLDTLKLMASISPARNVHGAIVDPKTNHAFCSSNPVVMWDNKTNKIIKTIDVQGGPDGILFDPFTQHVHILSHRSPNVTVIDTKDGSLVGTFDLGGQPEQGASDGAGKLYISLEDKSQVAVVDAKAMKVTAHYDMLPGGGQPAGLVLDARNHIIFACGRNPATCVAMNADDGKILATLPIGNGVDSAAWNPDTLEAFVSTRDGKLTIIKETDPKTFAVEQTVTTLAGGKTCAIDAKTGHVYVIANDPSVPPVPSAAPAAPATAPAEAATPGRGRGRGGPAGTFTVVVVGKESK